MSGVWHKNQLDAFDQFKRDLQKKYPDLCVQKIGDFAQIQGGFPVVQDGLEIDRFQIRVIIPPGFPKCVPAIFELGGRVPQNNPAWHTYDNGGLCLMVPEEWLINPQHDSLMAFLDGPVRNYFIAHALAEGGMGRPMGERPHFGAGLWEAYGEMVGSKDHATIQGYLECLAGERLRGHWVCPCGSGKKLRNCHMPYLFQLRKQIEPYVAESALTRLKKHEKKK